MRKAIYELMGEMKNKHKQLVIKKQVDPKWWLTCKSVVKLQKCTQIWIKAERQVGKLTHALALIYTPKFAYAQIQTLQALQRAFGVFILPYCSGDFCAVLFKCHSCLPFSKLLEYCRQIEGHTWWLCFKCTFTF